MAVESGRAPGGNQHPAGPTSSASTDANDAWAQWQAQAAAAWQRQPASDDSGLLGGQAAVAAPAMMCVQLLTDGVCNG
jgi:hypothetical protein